MSVPDHGAVLGGKYVVLSTLGRGGMGTVLRAKNKLTGKEVALKWMHSSANLSSEAAARLLREAEAASRVNHPNLVNVFDVMYEEETLFLVMELLEGETLRSYLEREPSPSIASLIALLLPAMHGVVAAHERGVIHRDLKPDNIFLVRGSGGAGLHAKVVDFGVAKVLNSEGMTLTRTGTSIGTPLYMSLEQLRADEDIDHRTDVYSFGVILYEAISGRLPYTATTLTEFAIKVATTSPTPIKLLRPDLPDGLADLVHRAIARNPEERPPDMAALIRELEPFAGERWSGAKLSARTPSALPLPASAIQASVDSLRETTKYATPATLPVIGERATREPATHPSKWFPSDRRRMFAAAALLAILAAFSYWLRAQARPEVREKLVRPAVAPTPTTDVSAATQQPSAAASADLTENAAHSPQPDVELPTGIAPAQAPQPPTHEHRANDKPVKHAQPAPRGVREARPASELRKAKASQPKTNAPRSEQAEPDLNDLGGRL